MAIIDGTAFDDDIQGTPWADNINGEAGEDILRGGLGDDILYGGSYFGPDVLIGGLGDDTYRINDTLDTIVEWPGKGLSDLVLSVIDYKLPPGVENLTLLSFADEGRGNASDNHIIGNQFFNRLDGRGGVDTLEGGEAGDHYFVDDPRDRVIELYDEGGDVVYSTASSYTLPSNVESLYLKGHANIAGIGNELANIMMGNDNDNFLAAGDGNDRIFAAPGDDQAEGGGGDDALLGAQGNDRMDGGSGNDFISGHGGNDVLIGGAGDDRMEGRDGDDLYVVDSAGDFVTEQFGSGIDRVDSSVDFRLRAGLENLVLLSGALEGSGNELDNSLYGNADANMLSGGEGADRLHGAEGDDSLYGGHGSDYLTGGEGADAFYFIVKGSDHLADFSSADDTIYLARTVFAAVQPGTLDAGAFHVGTSAGDTDDRVIYDDTTGRLFYDPDGTGELAAARFAFVTLGTELANTDFIAYG